MGGGELLDHLVEGGGDVGGEQVFGGVLAAVADLVLTEPMSRTMEERSCWNICCGGVGREIIIGWGLRDNNELLSKQELIILSPSPLISIVILPPLNNLLNHLRHPHTNQIPPTLNQLHRHQIINHPTQPASPILQQLLRCPLLIHPPILQPHQIVALQQLRNIQRRHQNRRFLFFPTTTPLKFR